MIRQPLNPRRLQLLTKREVRLITAIGDTVFPKIEGMPSVSEAKIVEYFDDLLVHLPFKEKLLIRSLLTLIELQMLAFNGFSPKLFTQASQEERERNLAGWESSSIFQRRIVFMAVRTLLLWAYVDSREFEQSVGYDSGTQATLRRQRQSEAVKRTIDTVATGESAEIRFENETGSAAE
jgi:hypothetical protein